MFTYYLQRFVRYMGSVSLFSLYTTLIVIHVVSVSVWYQFAYMPKLQEQKNICMLVAELQKQNSKLIQQLDCVSAQKSATNSSAGQSVTDIGRFFTWCEQNVIPINSFNRSESDSLSRFRIQLTVTFPILESLLHALAQVGTSTTITFFELTKTDRNKLALNLELVAKG